MADKIVVLRAGRIEQVGSPLELYNNPVNKFVAGFIGSPGMNFLKGTVSNGQITVPALDSMSIPCNAQLPAEGTEVLVGLRPQQLEISTEGPQLQVDIIEHLGGVAYMHLHTSSNEKLVVELRGKDTMTQQTQAGISINVEDVMLFDASTEQRIK